MTKPENKGDKGDKSDESPWRKTGDVRGVVPPGRRLSNDARPSTWSASGVRGVTPPGKLKPGEGAATRWILDQEKAKESREKKSSAKAKSKAAKRSETPQPPKGAKPAKGKSEEAEPKNLKEFLDLLADFARQNLPKEEGILEDMMSLVGQSQRPFDVIVCFTIGSALVGSDSKLRSDHQWSLERGAKAYFNYARRLDKNTKPPRGLMPETLDPIFFDVPGLALQFPYAYLTRSFLDHLDVLRVDRPHDRKLMRFAKTMYARFVEAKSFGDRPLTDMFPWSIPDWAPEDEE